MTSYIPFADVMGINSQNVPADPAVFPLVALYATGSQGIEATAAEITRFTSRGVGVILIDQTPSLSVFAAGIAHVMIADVEDLAGTPSSAAQAVLARERKGLESVIYLSRSWMPAATAALHATGADTGMVRFGVADWSLSQAQAEAYLAQTPEAVYVQWASPSSNPLTIEPGTNKTLKVTNADLDIADAAWAAQFIPHPKPVIPWYWHVADGKHSLAQIAASRNTTVAHLMQVTLDATAAEVRARLAAAPLKPGTSWASSNP